jgi:hypothetical protein
MHYKNGNKANTGDHILFTDWDGSVKTGVIHGLNPGAENCNATATFAIPGGCSSCCVTLKNCWLASDAFELSNQALPPFMQTGVIPS